MHAAEQAAEWFVSVVLHLTISSFILAAIGSLPTPEAEAEAEAGMEDVT